MGYILQYEQINYRDIREESWVHERNVDETDSNKVNIFFNLPLNINNRLTNAKLYSGKQNLHFGIMPMYKRQRLHTDWQKLCRISERKWPTIQDHIPLVFSYVFLYLLYSQRYTASVASSVVKEQINKK